MILRAIRIPNIRLIREVVRGKKIETLRVRASVLIWMLSVLSWNPLKTQIIQCHEFSIKTKKLMREGGTT